MNSFKDTFTPIFIVISLCIFIVGIILLQVISKLFIGSKHLISIQMFGITIIINIIILVFLIMSFSKVTFQVGSQGPTGNKGIKGLDGNNGGLQVCNKKYKTADEHKAYVKLQSSYDMKVPLINRE